MNKYIAMFLNKDKKPTLLLFYLTTCFFVVFAGKTMADEQAVWDALKSENHFGLMRHALAPGTGDPENFQLGECSTQRNLSYEGRNQAKAIGKRFREAGIDKAEVISSQWCRCVETAKLLNLGSVDELPALNSFFSQYEFKERQTRTLKKWLTEKDLKQPLVLVTHQVNITALTSVYPASGEIIVIKKLSGGKFSPVGSILLD